MNHPLLSLLSLVVFTATVVSSAHLSAQAPGKTKHDGWESLFDGKTLKGWKITQFGGEGAVEVEDGAITMDFGSYLTGITYEGDLPTTNYELALEAKRVDGIDFFCATTIPVDKSHCTLIVGGWAGAVVGLSNLDGQDASQNETTTYMAFKTDRWYRIRIRVRPDRIQAWIDDKQVVDVDIRQRRMDTRPEVDLSKPLGIAAWETRSALRRIRIRKLDGEKPAE
ncbi:MAG: DUF1080 domain-containing protein [Pirellulaceae bacterium]